PAAARTPGAAASDTVTIDTANPTVAVNIVDSSLSDSDPTSTVTFTFSEATTDFTAGDLTVVGGTITGFTGSGTRYSATLTADNTRTTTRSAPRATPGAPDSP